MWLDNKSLGLYWPLKLFRFKKHQGSGVLRFNNVLAENDTIAPQKEKEKKNSINMIEY